MATMNRGTMSPEPARREPMPTACGCGTSSGRAHALWCGGGSFFKKFMCTLAGVLLVYVIFYFGTLIRNNIKSYQFIGKADRMERAITINGYGKVNGNNDIAVTSLGYSNTDKDVAVAQAANKKVMDGILTELKRNGIADKDLKTDYTVYPEYNYTQDKGQELKGYKVSSNVTVKIRDLAKVPMVLSLVGKYGATQIGGLTFTIDDPENLKAEAREKALASARMKVADLAAALGVKIVGVMSYSEYEGGNPGYYDYAEKSAVLNQAGYAPEIASGSKDVEMNVAITYEIMPLGR